MNQLAHEAANQCMDSGCDFANWSSPPPHADISGQLKLICFSDGGVRSDVRQAVVGWIIVASVDGCCWHLGRGGSKVDYGDMGLFLAEEAVAVGILVDNVPRLCNHNGVLDNSWQVRDVILCMEQVLEVKRC